MSPSTDLAQVYGTSHTSHSGTIPTRLVTTRDDVANELYNRVGLFAQSRYSLIEKFTCHGCPSILVIIDYHLEYLLYETVFPFRDSIRLRMKKQLAWGIRTMRRDARRDKSISVQLVIKGEFMGCQ